jgi:hypothetical protein
MDHKKHKADSFFVLFVTRYVLFVYRFRIVVQSRAKAQRLPPQTPSTSTMFERAAAWRIALGLA